jgi:hypothetical protein
LIKSQAQLLEGHLIRIASGSYLKVTPIITKKASDPERRDYPTSSLLSMMVA